MAGSSREKTGMCSQGGRAFCLSPVNYNDNGAKVGSGWIALSSECDTPPSACLGGLYALDEANDYLYPPEAGSCCVKGKSCLENYHD